jgi:ElaB/YqjD/DUF883 family membrane-anchored ribosome-binding protein
MEGSTFRDRATQVLGHTREFARERAEQVRTFTHEKPFLATILGLGAGFVLGMLMSPRGVKVHLVRSKDLPGSGPAC